jgi:hypothetical protein
LAVEGTRLPITEQRTAALPQSNASRRAERRSALSPPARAPRRTAFGKKHAQVLEKKSSICDLALQTSVPPWGKVCGSSKVFPFLTANFATFLALIEPYCVQKPVRFEFVFLELLLNLNDLSYFAPLNLTSFLNFHPFSVLADRS